MSEPRGRLQLSSDTRPGSGGEIKVLRVEGDVDLANASELAAALKPEAPHAGLILDLTGVPFMDSSGLREILVSSEELGDRLAVVVEPGSAVRQLLDIAEVAERLNLQDSEADALAAVEGGDGRG